MSRFDFALNHIASKSMGQVDSLSRRADWAEGVERNNKNQEEIMEKIKKLEAKDNEMVKMVEEMKKTKVKVLRNNKWQIEDELVLKKAKMYVLKNKILKLEIIWLHHDIPITGHK